MSSSFVIVGAAQLIDPTDVADNRVVDTAWADGLNAQLSIYNETDAVCHIVPTGIAAIGGLACPPGTTLITPPVRNGAALWVTGTGSGAGVHVTPLLTASERR
jgi:hypothetical protein